LYILQLFHDGSLGDASVTSVTEYLLTQPIYSFVVSGHTPLSSREGSVSGEDGEGEDEKTTTAGEFDSRRNIVLIKLHCIQSR
jgi:enhancer of mRNA-decapping protein 4